MTATPANTVSFAARLWPTETNAGRVLRAVTLVVAGSIALWISAKVQVPFWPIPATLQSLVVIMIGVSFGSRLGLATVLAYLAQGAAGLPVFAGTPEKGIGLLYMTGPTGGFLLGFAVAAFVVGWLVERGHGRGVLSMLGVAFVGNALVYAFGLPWLASLIGMQKAVTFGALPFLLSDVVKIALAATLTVATSRALKL